MHGHAPPCHLLGRSAFQLLLPSIHRTAERDCLKSSYRLRTKALRVNVTIQGVKPSPEAALAKSHAPIELGGYPVASIQRVAESETGRKVPIEPGSQGPTGGRNERRSPISPTYRGKKRGPSATPTPFRTVSHRAFSETRAVRRPPPEQ